jgi:hypothetical protein
VVVDGNAMTDPKEISKHRWSAHLMAVWDIAQAKFMEQKITRSAAKKGD